MLFSTFLDLSEPSLPSAHILRESSVGILRWCWLEVRDLFRSRRTSLSTPVSSLTCFVLASAGKAPTTGSYSPFGYAHLLAPLYPNASQIVFVIFGQQQRQGPSFHPTAFANAEGARQAPSSSSSALLRDWAAPRLWTFFLPVFLLSSLLDYSSIRTALTGTKPVFDSAQTGPTRRSGVTKRSHPDNSSKHILERFLT